MKLSKEINVIIKLHTDDPEDKFLFDYIESLPKRVNGGRNLVLKNILLQHARNVFFEEDEEMPVKKSPVSKGITLTRQPKDEDISGPPANIETKIRLKNIAANGLKSFGEMESSS